MRIEVLIRRKAMNVNEAPYVYSSEHVAEIYMEQSQREFRKFWFFKQIFELEFWKLNSFAFLRFCRSLLGSKCLGTSDPLWARRLLYLPLYLGPPLCSRRPVWWYATRPCLMLTLTPRAASHVCNLGFNLFSASTTILWRRTGMPSMSASNMAAIVVHVQHQFRCKSWRVAPVVDIVAHSFHVELDSFQTKKDNTVLVKLDTFQSKLDTFKIKLDTSQTKASILLIKPHTP